MSQSLVSFTTSVSANETFTAKSSGDSNSFFFKTNNLIILKTFGI